MDNVSEDAAAGGSTQARPSASSAPKRSKSHIWDYFELRGDSSKCKTCLVSIKRSQSSTSSMRYHLKVKHAKLFLELENKVTI